MKMNEIQKRLIEEVADLHDVPMGAYNFRANGKLAGRNTTANIDIQTKTEGSGIDIRIKDNNRFLLGSVMPDAYADICDRNSTHYITQKENQVYFVERFNVCLYMLD